MSDVTTDDHHQAAIPDEKTRFRQKVVMWLIAAIVLLFWHEILEITLHVLHILLEYLELGTEELLIHLFHLEEHEGQMYTAWLGLSAFVALITWSYVSIRRRIRAKFRSWAYFKSWTKIYLREHWLSLTLISSVYFAYLFLF
jgi:hypothetical protein